MKRVLLFVFVVLSAMQLSAQCSEIFISGYVEGSGNNRAIEIYNPTDIPVNLSGYSIGRFSNGDGLPNQYEGIQLPDAMLASQDVYVIVLDKRDSLGTGFELPVWNGYQAWGPEVDPVSGDTTYRVQWDTVNGVPLYGDIYRDFLDLEGKADVFLCPVYNTNNAMYFNGNDAVVLISGTEVQNDASNIIDVVGVIGEDPDDTWRTSTGRWITKNTSLSRRFDIAGGTGIISGALGDTIPDVEWDFYFNNDFSGLGEHACVCAGGTSTDDLNQVAFNMFPNPLSQNQLNIQAEEVIQQVIIHNILGETVLVSEEQSFSKQMTLDIPDLSNGVYTVSIAFDGNKRSIQKLMIQK